MLETKPQILLRHAQASDQPAIMRHIETEWKAGHILATDGAFFHYEYVVDGSLNFILATDSQNNIVGMLGYIRASSAADCDVWTTMWKVSKHAANPVLGIELLQFLRARGHRSVMSLGINARTIGIYKYLGFNTGCMAQFYMLNPRRQAFKIAVVKPTEPDCRALPTSHPDYAWREIATPELARSVDFTAQADLIPAKDYAYFSKRYFQHPIYRYEIYGVFHGADLVTLLVMREVAAEGARALRIVDILGDAHALQFIGAELQALLIKRDLEYVDLVCHGMPAAALTAAGFAQLDLDSSDTIVPNYFGPFIQKNVKVHYFSDSADVDRFRFFKADGDQDRPG